MIVSDFRGERDWETPLQTLRARHGVLAVEIVDPREQQLVPAGDLWLVDPETGRQLHVDTRRKKVRQRFEQAAAAERDEVRAALRRAGADHVVLSTAGDWLQILAGHLRRSEAALRAGAPARAAVRNRIQAGRSDELRRTAPARRVHPDPAGDARLRVAAAPPPARVRGVGEPRAGAEPDHRRGPAGAATCRRCCCCSRSTALIFALARPQRTVAAPQRAANIVMVTDISGSMNATDVQPGPPDRRRPTPRRRSPRRSRRRSGSA